MTAAPSDLMKHIGATLCLVVAIVVGAKRAPQDPQDQRRPSRRPSTWCRLTSTSSTKTGHPVTSLEAKDFALTIDGRPRRIASAQYVPSGRGAEPARAAADYYSTNATPRAAG